MLLNGLRLFHKAKRRLSLAGVLVACCVINGGPGPRVRMPPGSEVVEEACLAMESDCCPAAARKSRGHPRDGLATCWQQLSRRAWVFAWAARATQSIRRHWTLNTFGLEVLPYTNATAKSLRQNVCVRYELQRRCRFNVCEVTEVQRRCRYMVCERT